VFVQSREGNTAAANPSALGGGDTDKHLIYEGLSRVAVDAVLAGAETIRGGNLLFSVWHPQMVALRAALGKSRHPAQVIATLRGLDVERSLIFNVPSIPVFLITVGVCVDLMQASLASRPWITPIVLPRKDDLRAGFEQLREAGLERISCIGGRSIASQLIDAALVQEIYLTTSPKSGGEPDTPFYDQPLAVDVIVRKHGRNGESGVVFEHLIVRR
jgi:riboflavin biosynthesis pyrimidine reductase